MPLIIFLLPTSQGEVVFCIHHHGMKNVRIWSFFWSVFSRTRTEYREILRISPYSVRMRENTDQKNSEYGHVSSSAYLNPFLANVSILYLLKTPEKPWVFRCFQGV